MSAELDRIKGGLLALIRDLVAPTDYHALYPCTVVSQNADGSLELRAESTKVSVPSKVPILLGLPGARAKLEAGASVLLGFEGGDPRRPRAMLWGESVITELALNGGTVGLAKADHTHSVTVTAGQLSGANVAAANGTISCGPPNSNTSLFKVP